MSIKPEQVIDFFQDPQRILSLSDKLQWQLVIILRQQKLLARYAFFSQRLGVTPLLHKNTQRHFKNALKIAQRQKQQVLQEATQLSALLRQESDFVVFLKGAAYSLSDARVGHGRIYSDIDILVNKEQLKACEQALALSGWMGQEISDYDDKYYRKWAHEIPPLVHMHRGTIIDVHHNIVPIISNDAPTVAALAQFIVTHEHGIQMLSPAAQFVHSSVHLFRNEDYSTAFRDLLDLYLLWQEYSQINQTGTGYLHEINKVADVLGFRYEVALAYDALRRDFVVDIDSAIIRQGLNKSALRVAFDRFIFSRVLRPQHRLMPESEHAICHFLAVMRGHCVKMPLPILLRHLVIKSGRGLIESVFGEHVFTPKDDTAMQVQARANQTK